MSDLALGSLPPQRMPARPMALIWLGVAVSLVLILATAYTGSHAMVTLGAVTSTLVILAWRRTLLAWPTLLGLIVAVILFVPVRRYTLGDGLPFGLEPYRVLIALVLVAWLLALLVDARTRFRPTDLDRPVLLLLAAIGCSLVFNAGRVTELSGTVAKGLVLFLSFLLVMYFVSSAARRRPVLDGMVKLFVIGGTLIALSAVAEWRTGYNVFDHLDRVIPLLNPVESAYVGSLERGDRPRAYASAQHSIALGAALAIIMPFAVYLHRRTGSFVWMAAAAILTLGALATGSRTAIVMLATTLVVFLVVKRRATIRLLPLLLPLVLVVQIAMPGSLGTFRAVFFPEEGLVAEEHGDAGQSGSGRLADVGPSLKEWGQTPLFGQGLGTRLTSADDPQVNALILDNQWLGSLLELGALGFFALVWLFVRAIRRLGRHARSNDEPHGWLLSALCAAIAAYAIGMFTYDAFSFVQVTLLLFVMLGLSGPALRLAEAE
jgi:polysaccharide biosynthesis protein PslJ